MINIVYKTKEEGNEKHLPIMKKIPNGVKIIVGETLHPMEKDHRISIIEIVLEDGSILRKILKPEDNPSVVFNTDKNIVELRAFCNKHGRWKNVL